MSESERRAYAAQWLKNRADKGWHDHWPVRSCLGCGGSSPFGYMQCSRTGLFWDDGTSFTYRQLVGTGAVAGQTELFG